jgi:hypothetical protein
MRKKLKLSYGGGDSSGKKCTWGCDGNYDEVWRKSDVRGPVLSCVGKESGFGQREDVLTFNLL